MRNYSWVGAYIVVAVKHCLALQHDFHPCEALSADDMSQGAAALCAGWSVQDTAAQLAAGIAAQFTAAQAQLWQQGQDTAGNRELRPKAEQWSYPREGGPDPGAWEGYSSVIQLPPGCGGNQRRTDSTTAAATTTQCAAAGEHGSAVAELSFLTAQQVCSERSSSVLSATAPDDTALFIAQLRCLNEIVAVVEHLWECLDPTVRAAACSEVLAHKDAWVSPSKDTISLLPPKASNTPTHALTCAWHRYLKLLTADTPLCCFTCASACRLLAPGSIPGQTKLQGSASTATTQNNKQSGKNAPAATPTPAPTTQAPVSSSGGVFACPDVSGSNTAVSMYDGTWNSGACAKYACWGEWGAVCRCPSLAAGCLGKAAFGDDKISSMVGSKATTTFIYKDAYYVDYLGYVGFGINCSFGGTARNNAVSSFQIRIGF
eukprot:19765-Heterococcus_DN1.PRE.2